MKVDFSKVSINATVEGDPVVIDLTKEVGNLVYGRTADIAVSDFGKKIYYSKEAIDVPRPMAESIKADNVPVTCKVMHITDVYEEDALFREGRHGLTVSSHMLKAVSQSFTVVGGVIKAYSRSSAPKRRSSYSML